MWKEFKEFALKGNVLDLAIGVILGAAFGKIVSSLVNDILMPVIGILFGGINFQNLKIVLKPATEKTAEVAIMYGSFIQAAVDFLIIAFSVFLFVKFLSSLKKEAPEEKPAATPEPSKEEILLTEIRDILKSK